MSKPNIAWLADYTEEALGPIQRDEALLLYAFARAVGLRRVLEFGAGKGHSARVWLEAGCDQVFSMDPWISPEVRALAAAYGDRLTIIEGDMRTYESSMTGPLDLVFFDAAHDPAANLATLARLAEIPPWILIHDTGTWAAEHMTPAHRAFPGLATPDGGLVHQPGEVIFAAILEKQPGLQRIDFHSIRALRHGLTLFQRR
jgi:hypothetical protein